MLKEKMVNIFGEVFLSVSSIFGLVDDEPKIDGKPVQEWIQKIPYNDEYEFNQYEITDSNEEEINGIALDNVRDDNMGIYLMTNELEFKVKEGDKILVIFDDEDIVDVEKMD